jgi:serine/threonine protein kinase
MYKAPETATALHYNEKVDIWSFGLTILQVAFNLPDKPPFDPDDQRDHATLDEHTRSASGRRESLWPAAADDAAAQ